MTPKKTKSDEILDVLEKRFNANRTRHKGVRWEQVRKRLEKVPGKIAVLVRMEETGGEPDVTEFDKKSGEILFCDCSSETPLARRSTCYDKKAHDSRKEHKPGKNAEEMAREIGIEILDEKGYKKLQEVGPFDQKTSSWIRTPSDVRKLGGALFGDFRFGRVFIYHNGAESYYGSRGFRGCLRV